MKKKFLLSIFAFVFCLPMMFLATACGDDAPKLNSIELDTTNAKTTFFVGEDFVNTGLIVRGVYSDNTKTVVGEYTINSSQYKKDTAGKYYIFVTVNDLTEVYSVTVVLDSVASITATPRGKYFIGQDFSTNVDVALVSHSGETNKITNFTYENFDNSTEGVKTVTVSYLDVTTQVNVEVLSNASYVNYIKEKIQSHIVESNNCQGPTFDETEPTASLDYDIRTAISYLEEDIYAANDGDLWYFSSDNKQFWFEFATNTLYLDDGEDASKKIFTNGFEALKFIVDDITIEGLSDEKSLVFMGLYNPEAFFAQLAYANDWTMDSASLDANVLTINLDNTGNTYIKLDYTNNKILEYAPSSILKYSFDSVVSIPAVSQDVVEYDTAIKDLSIEIPNKFFVGQDFRTNAIITAYFVKGDSQQITAYSFTGFDKTLVGKQTVTIIVGDKTKTVEVEVLSNVDYATYSKEKLNDHIISSSNCSLPFDEEIEPTATLDFDIKTAAHYYNGAIKYANNGKIWYVNLNPAELWYDYATRIMYIRNDGTHTKKSFAVNFDAMKYIPENFGDMGIGNIGALFSLLYNPDLSYASYLSADFEISSVNILNDVMTINIGDNSYMKIDYRNWRLIEVVHTALTRTEFNKTISVPTLPTADWVDITTESIEAEPINKFFVGQDLKTNMAVTVNCEDGSTETTNSYTFSNYDDDKVGVQSVTINYHGKSTTVEIEVLNNSDYLTLVKEKINTHIVSSTNCSTPFDETVEPTAQLDFEIGAAACYLSGNLYAANNGEIWYFKQGSVEFWYDYATKTLYVANGETNVKKTFDANYDAMEYIVDTYADLGFGSTGALFSIIYNPETTYANFVNTQWELSSISLEDDVLTMNLNENNYVKLNYSDWKVTEVNTASLNYQFNVEVEIPSVPEVEWTTAE